MSVLLQEPPRPPVRRVRHDVRDAVTVACFSAVASAAVALVLVLGVTLLAGLVSRSA